MQRVRDKKRERGERELWRRVDASTLLCGAVWIEDKHTVHIERWWRERALERKTVCSAPRVCVHVFVMFCCCLWFSVLWTFVWCYLSALSMWLTLCCVAVAFSGSPACYIPFHLICIFFSPSIHRYFTIKVTSSARSSFFVFKIYTHRTARMSMHMKTNCYVMSCDVYLAVCTLRLQLVHVYILGFSSL